MADQEIPTMDYVEHERTYNGFIKLTKWSIGLVVVVLVGLALLV
ncbi:MAG: aa3-type cytochrome c oxidase subunit IV [Alphaproteobacteria bacterium]